jgi:rhodanese-related sulfurtransferase
VSGLGAEDVAQVGVELFGGVDGRSWGLDAGLGVDQYLLEEGLVHELLDVGGRVAVGAGAVLEEVKGGLEVCLGDGSVGRQLLEFAAVALNPQYTALIGGRGTGKSTILDYVRWALCDQPARSTEDDEVADPRVRQRRLIEATLKPLEAHVEVHCVINGITHVVRRHASDGAVLLKVGEGPFEKVRETAIQSLLPIQAYSQKQLSSVAIRVDELLRFVTSPIQHELEEVDRKQQEVAGRFRENYGTLQRYRNLTAEIQRSEIRIRSLAEQAQALRDGLAGLSEDDRKVLDSKSAHDGARSVQSVWQQHLEDAHADLHDVVSGLDASLGDISRPSTVPGEIEIEVDALLTASSEALASLRSTIAGLMIDQPEDDLDSDTVQAIVAKIWASKSDRQLIFSSHNANLVVNGDADLVLVCAYANAGDQSAGYIKEQGAIDVAAVRDQITSVMEGGEKAFRLRKEKYGF